VEKGAEGSADHALVVCQDDATAAFWLRSKLDSTLIPME
jgi:hypothetical protein